MTARQYVDASPRRPFCDTSLGRLSTKIPLQEGFGRAFNLAWHLTIAIGLACTVLGPCISDAPDGAAGIVGNEQRTILGNRKRGRSAPDFRPMHAGDPEANGEILVPSLRTAILEWHEHDLVTGWFGSVPRPFEGNKGAAAEFGRKLFAIVENTKSIAEECASNRRSGLIEALTLSGSNWRNPAAGARGALLDTCQIIGGSRSPRPSRS